MPSSKTSSGSAQPGGHLSSQSNRSSVTTRQPTSLGFATSRDPINVRRDGHLGRHERWDSGRQHERVVAWQRVVDQNRQPKEYRIPGILIAGLMTVLCGLMAYTALTNESVLLRIESSADKVR
jgi:hypothetical protein